MSPAPKAAAFKSERIYLQDMTCPLIRVDDARRRQKRDKRLGFLISLALHAVIIVVVGITVIKQPQFAVDEGRGGIEVSLVAAPSEPTVEQKPIEPELPPEPSDFVERREVELPKEKKPPEPVPVKTKGKDEVTAQSTGGALSEARPDYLSNPAPEYPEEARRRGREGLVILSARIDREGHPVEVIVEQGSGYRLFDEAALKAVRKWQFHPAKIGNIPVESTVRVPIRFSLKDA